MYINVLEQINEIMLKKVCYTDLLYLWNQGKKNGPLNRFGYLKRGLFSAALEYCKMTGQIITSRLIEVIESVAEIIRNTVGQNIFRRGIDRASAMTQNIRLMKIFLSPSKWKDRCVRILAWHGSPIPKKFLDLVQKRINFIMYQGSYS